VEKTAWLKRVAITDAEMGYPENRGNLENTLANNLLRFLRDGKYFKRVELLPGRPQAEDYVLQFQFNRYRQSRNLKGIQYYDSSDLSATLTITHPDGQLVKEVKSDLKEEHGISSMSEEAGLPSGMRARTQIVEELLEKALFAPNPVP
jgi:hypothetical protein